VAEAYGKLPLSFEANVGQTDGHVRFIAHGVGYHLFLTTTEAVLALRETVAEGQDAKVTRPAAGGPTPGAYRVLRMKLAGSNAGADAAGLDVLQGKYNYFIGDDPARWRTDVPVYAKAEFRGIYEGVDLVYYGNQSQLEYDFQVAPGADPRAIKLLFEGADAVEVTGEGDLVLKVKGGAVCMRRPVIYQSAEDGARQQIEGRYVVRGKNTAAFEVGAYDAQRPLVIDPVLSYSSYLGAAGQEIGYGIAAGADGSAYVTGETSSFTFPTTGQNFIPFDNGTGHAFVTRLNPAGTALVYSTLIGGSAGDTGYGIAVDNSGSAYITGRTTSANFPTVNSLRGGTNLIKSTDAGGSWAASNAGLGNLTVSALAVVPSNPSTVYAATSGGNGIYKSADGGATWNPLSTGFSSASALVIDPQNSSTIYAAVNQTFFGVIKSTDGGASWTQVKNGLSGGGINALAIDPSTPATVYAGTFGGVFKTTNGGTSWAQANNGLNFFGVFSIVVDPSNPSTVYASAGGGGVFKTTNGGTSWVQMKTGLTNTTVRSISIDPTNPSVLHAATFGGGVFKTTDGAASWSPSNTGLTNPNVNILTRDPNAPLTLYAGTSKTGIFKTTDGGANWLAIYSGLTGPSVNALATGPSATVYAGLDLRASGSNPDSEAFVAKLTPAGNALVYSTYLGGSGNDDGSGIAVNSAGQAHVVGTTASNDFPLANPRQATLGGGNDAFITKLDAAGNALVYSTYLGGSSQDTGRGVAVDPGGNAYVAGDTASANFTTTPGAFQTTLSNPASGFGEGDAFVTKLDPTGSSFIYSTYLGGSGGSEFGFAVAADSDGNAYVAGTTSSSSFPLHNPAQATFGGGGSSFGDAFATKLNPTGSALVYSTYLGGTNSDYARGIAVAADGTAIIAGSTESPDFPVTADSLASKSGLFRSLDGGATWDNRNNGLSGQIVHVVGDPQTPSTLYAATSEAVFKSTNEGRTWARTGTGLPCCLERLAIDPKNPSVLYVTSFSGAGIYKSTDGGASWAPSNNNQNFFQTKALAVDPVSTNNVYVGTFGVFKSTNGGASWGAASAGIPQGTQINTLTIDPSNPTTLYATGGSFARLYKSTNGGGSWSLADTGLPGNAQTLRVAIVPSNPSTIFAATTVGLFKSTDGGTSWVMSFDSPFLSDIVLDPQNATPYISLEVAKDGSPAFVYKSLDGGATWQPTGGPSFHIHGLAINTASTIFGFTDSSGGIDAFITKLNAAGSGLVYSTYLGGQQVLTSNEAMDIAFGVAADPAGNAYVTGLTRSLDFPTTPDAFQTINRGFDEAFVVKLEESFNVSGRATNGGALQPGVRVTLSGDELRAVTTGADGSYVFSNLRRGGNYTVSASKVGFTFAPPSQTFDNLGASQTADFSASASVVPFQIISGRVAEPGGAAVPGVTVKLTGSQLDFALTDAGGSYSFNVPAGGDYTVTPSALGFAFNPPARTFNSLAANVAADFTAARQDLVVANTNDHGAGSLRQAITDANSIPGRDRIVFNIPGAGVKTISPDAALPDLTGPVVIDASTQPGYVGAPLVELDGGRTGGSSNGLRLTGGDSVVRGLAISRFNGGTGIVLAGNGNVVEGCYLGINAAGVVNNQPNHTGVSVSGANNRIGSTTPAARNVISGNSFEGVTVFGAGNQIKGNFIGTDPSGGVAIPNGTRGIEISGSTDPAQTAGNVVGGTETGARNVVSGNGNGGITTRALGTVIQGNFVGTDVTGTVALGNSVGISLEGRNSTIGGATAAARNVISGQGAGINVSTFSNDPQNLIQGNYIGLDASGTHALGNGTGIEVNSPNTSIGGTETGAGNVISGNLSGIECRLGNAFIRGNLIGTDASGNLPVGNQSGVLISSNNNVVGGTVSGARNIISGNIVGVQLGGNTTATPSGNVVQGNLIGMNASGSAPLPNILSGIGFGGASGNQIGGDETGAGNVIAFNRTGLAMSSFQNVNNLIRGNSIFSNALLGIDLNADLLVTPNDLLDPDAGANNLQNFPLLSSVSSSGGTTHVEGSLISTPNTQFRIDFYSNLACDASGYGEGARPFGSTTVTTSASGNAALNVDLAQALAQGRTLTATATDPTGNTSEFSPCDAARATGSLEYEFADMSVLEDVGSAIVKVVRRGGSRGAASVNFATVDGTATAGSDYTSVSGTLNFAEGETVKTFAVPIANDGVTETEETVRLTLGGAADLESLGGQPVATLHILDSSTPLNLSVEFPNGPPLNLPEGDAGRHNEAVTVKLNAATGRTVTVDYATVAFADSATPGVDFEHVSGSLTFAPGVERMQVLIPIIGDTLDENNEFFGLGLTNAVNAAAGPTPFNITILDDDPLPALSVSDLTVVEEPGAKAVFNVRLSAASARSISVGYFTADGTATANANADYRQTFNTLIFNPGETVKTVEVPITADAIAEADETFSLNLANPFRASIADPTGIATITESSSVSLVQFSAASYGVSEADRFVDVTVTRTGNTSGAASVAYETVGQTASEKSDFTTSLGSLRFGPGEASKTFRVLVTDDVFKEPAESLDLLLSNPSGTALGSPSVAVLTITSDDAADGPSPVKGASFNSEFFVRQHYRDFLNREPDAAGLQFWTNEIEQCGTNAQCREVKRINVSAAFFLSIEFQETGYLVYRMYKTAYGDINPPAVPVPVRLREFLADSQEIGRGVQVGIGAWQQQLEENKNSFAAVFVARTRFNAAYPQAMTAEQFVDRLNANAGNPLSQSERDALVSDLSTGTKTRAQVLRAVAEDADLVNSGKRKAFVLMQYFGYLRRDPDAAPDTDFGGFNFWLGKLNQFNGNFVQAEMVRAFIESIEYGDRFGR
jgi:hypothetical protein